MTEHGFETRLDGLFRAYAERGVQPVDRFAIAEATLASARVQPARFRWASTRWRMALVGALLLALAATTAIVGSRLLNQPIGLADAPTYAAIVLRDTPGARGASVDVVLALPDGRESLVRRITSADLGDRVLSSRGKVSPNGWLSLYVGGLTAPTRAASVALIDLNDPSRPTTFVQTGAGPSTAWSTNDLFAYPDPRGTCFWSMLITDVRTGMTEAAPCLSLPGGGPDTIWAADGSGLLTQRGGGALGITPLDGGPASSTVPRLGPNGPRWVTEGGRTFETTGVEVNVRAMGGLGTTWYADDLAPDTLVDAAFSFDGAAVWLLLDRTSGASRQAVLAKANVPGGASIAASIDVPPVATFLQFSVLSPDDSMFTIWAGRPTDEPGWTILASVDGASIAVDGNVAGFVGGPLVDAAFGSN